MKLDFSFLRFASIKCIIFVNYVQIMFVANYQLVRQLKYDQQNPVFQDTM